MTVVRWETDVHETIDVACESSAAAEPIANSDRWLIAVPQSTNVVLGVYAFEEGWLAPLTAIGEAGDTTIFALSSNGTAASVLWGTREDSRGIGIADLSEPTVRTPVERRDGALDSDADYAIAQLDDRAIAVGTAGSGLWSSVLREGAAASAIHVPADRVYGNRPMITASEQHGLLAVCYETSVSANSHGISVVVIDREGRAVSDSLVLSEENWSIYGCDLAWSDDALLVAWGDIAYDEVENRSHVTVLARRLVVER
jgi:hypothetical protein